MDLKRVSQGIKNIFVKHDDVKETSRPMSKKYDICINGIRVETESGNIRVKEENIDLNRLRNLGKAQYPAVGRCIYCWDNENLQREHIIPFGLSGTAVLPKSSCAACAKITSHFERKVLHGPMWAVRVLRQLKSRTKHVNAPKTAPLKVKKAGNEIEVELPLNEYPILLHFPIFAPPAFLTPAGYTKGINISGVASVSFGVRPEEVLSKIEATEIAMPQDYEPVAFARMIAKIAYATAFAEGLTNLIDGEPLVLPAILGQRDEIGTWVGTFTDPYRSFKGLLHRIVFHQDTERGILMGEVQLFSDSQTPSYGVILGRLK